MTYDYKIFRAKKGHETEILFANYKRIGEGVVDVSDESTVSDIFDSIKSTFSLSDEDMEPVKNLTWSDVVVVRGFCGSDIALRCQPDAPGGYEEIPDFLSMSRANKLFCADSETLDKIASKIAALDIAYFDDSAEKEGRFLGASWGYDCFYRAASEEEARIVRGVARGILEKVARLKDTDCEAAAQVFDVASAIFDSLLPAAPCWDLIDDISREDAIEAAAKMTGLVPWEKIDFSNTISYRIRRLMGGADID